MKTIIHLLIFLVSSVQASGQVLNHESFVEIELPLPETTAWYQLSNKYNQGVKVSIEHGGLKMELVKVRKGDVNYKLPYGTLLAKNRGEFGGKLYYKPYEKSVKRITINRKLNSQLEKPHLPFLNLPFKEEENEESYFALRGGDINSFFKFNDSLYFTSGLAHMGSNTGSLNRLTYSSDDTFLISEVLDLEGAPMAETIAGDKLIFITYDGMLVVKDFKKIINLKELFWASLNPNSVVYLNEKEVYIGMNGCYAILDLKSHKMKCFKLKD